MHTMTSRTNALVTPVFGVKQPRHVVLTLWAVTVLV